MVLNKSLSTNLKFVKQLRTLKITIHKIIPTSETTHNLKKSHYPRNHTSKTIHNLGKITIQELIHTSKTIHNLSKITIHEIILVNYSQP